jgi:hypothetical protein
MAVTILSKTRGRPVIGTNRSDYVKTALCQPPTRGGGRRNRTDDGFPCPKRREPKPILDKSVMISRFDNHRENPPPPLHSLTGGVIAGVTFDAVGNLWYADFTKGSVSGPLLFK